VNEELWLRSVDPGAMLRQLGPRVTARKLRLFLCACMRLRYGRPSDEQDIFVLEVAERAADGVASAAELATARSVHCFLSSLFDSDADLLHRAATRPRSFNGDEEEQVARACLVHEVFGNPFRPVALDPDWLAWKGGCVYRMARAVYEGRRFKELPVLADALEGVGCTDAALLAHCRNGLRHFRGCWALDRLLGLDELPGAESPVLHDPVGECPGLLIPIGVACPELTNGGSRLVSS
jgi:hypothetical protein